MPSFAQLGSLLTGLGLGGVFGVYLGQTYEMPNVNNLLEQFTSWSAGYERKRETKENDRERSEQ